MSDALAYFITFRCHGTWLHGDDRGSVDRRTNAFDSQAVEANPARREWERQQRHGPPVELTAAQRGVVKRTILEVCETRGWNLFAINVRTNHVHVVVTATAPPERVLNDFKAWCTRRLRECGLASPGVHIWSRHGSTRHLWTDEHVAVAKHYVLYEQDHARPHA